MDDAEFKQLQKKAFDLALKRKQKRIAKSTVKNIGKFTFFHRKLEANYRTLRDTADKMESDFTKFLNDLESITNQLGKNVGQRTVEVKSTPQGRSKWSNTKI